jgi:hypothetical protein
MQVTPRVEYTPPAYRGIDVDQTQRNAPPAKLCNTRQM